MTTAQVQCFGCNRNFTPNGLSQHFSKSPDPRCHDARSVSRQVELVSAPFPRTASPAPNPDHVSPGSGRVNPDDLDVPNYSLGGRDDDSEMYGRDDMHSPGSGRVSPDAPDDLGMHDYSLGGRDDNSEMDLNGHDGTLSPGSGRVSPDDLGTHDYSLGRRNDDSETDGHDGTLSPGSGRVSPDDLGMHNYDLGRQDDEMDRHNGTQSPDGGFSAACVAI